MSYKNQRLCIHHKAAAKHHQEAAEYHRSAANCYEDGEIEKAIYNAQIANAHQELIKQHLKEVLRINYL